MIQPNKIDVLCVEHFDSEGKSLGFLNEHESNDLRCQIAEHNICDFNSYTIPSGYYLMFNNEKIEIMVNGKINNWPSGLYDKNEILLARLFTAQRGKR